MVNLTLNMHIPLLRLDREKVPFLGGVLWQMPFETFDGLLGGAFTDHKQAYEATRPVFYNRELQEKDPPWLHDTRNGPNSVMELKLATSEKGYYNELSNSYPFNIFHSLQYALGDPVWESLLLAMPNAQLVQPRHSITFLNADNEANFFKIGNDGLTSMANFRGDTDIEYLLMPEAVSPQVGPETLVTASACFKLLEHIKTSPELNMALTALKSSSLPYLSGEERFSLSVTALENLVIPEVYQDISKTFSTRIGALISTTSEQYAKVTDQSKALYKVRSQNLHGLKVKREMETPAYESQNLLASCILALAQQIAAGSSLEQVLDKAGGKQPLKPTDEQRIIPAQVVNTSNYTMLKKKFTTSGSFSSGAKTALPDKKDLLLHWSPLIGLHLSEEVTFKDLPFFLTPMKGNDLVSLEDKDIRRDFVSPMRFNEQEVAVIGVGMLTDPDKVFLGHAESPEIVGASYTRNLITIALRLSGFKMFTDPELLGHYLFHGNMRTRQASVLRQSIYMRYNSGKGETFASKDVQRLRKKVRLLQQYTLEAYSMEIDAILNLYRRMHESQYLPLSTRATVAFIILEKMLGPFRNKKDPVQLEKLVNNLLGANKSAQAFEEYGRKFRNSLAHGYWDSAKQGHYFQWLLEIVDAALTAMLEVWLVSENREQQRPRKILTNNILATAD